MQADGKILVAGNYYGTNNGFAVARYLVNQAPEVANAIQDKEATEDSVFNFTVPVETFSDANAGDILSYTATLANDDLLPTWLNFNPDTLTFTGTPTSQDVGSLDIKVTAKDAAGDEANDVFTLAVDEKVEDEGFSLNFENLVVNIQATEKQVTLGTDLQGKYQGELIDLRSQTQSVTANFAVNREASYNNYVGFYQVADENGGIDTNGDGKADILVGQAGYTQAAVRGRVAGIDLTVNNQGTANYTGTFQPGSIFAPFIIVDCRADAILDSNANNDPKVYFSFLGANSDKVDHIRLLGNNTFGFEDLPNGGDKDYNDVIVPVNLSVNVA